VKSARGAVAVLAAFLLLALMAGAGLATSANVLRELAMGADAGLGARAAGAADGGLEWFRAWSAGGGAGPGAFMARLEGQPPGVEIALPGPPRRMAGEPGATALEADLDLCLRRLGVWPGQGGAGPVRHLWAVVATGRCRTGGREFVQARELVFSAPAAAAPESPEDPAGPGQGVRIHARRPVPSR
jgi:hypothetical protein